MATVRPGSTPALARKGKGHMPTYKDKDKNTWYCKFYYTDWQGIKRQKLKRGFALQREAKEYERSFLEQYARDPDITFKTLAKKYLKFKENRIKPTALKTQTDIINNHILPYFENRKIADITSADIIDWQNKILSMGYSSSFTRSINAQISMLFSYAEKYMNLSRKPVIPQICKPRRANVSFWTPEQYKLFSDSIKDKIELFTAFEILYYTGIRKGELLALTLEDVDFGKKTLRINKTWAYVDGKCFAQPPKTEKSNRVIELPDFLLAEIQEYTRRIYGIQPESRLFERSTVWLRDFLIHQCKKIGLDPIRIHDFRHSHASLLINMGANPLMIAERLGHENVNITMQTYSHLFDSHQREIIEKLNNLRF